jgi:hypothetical protein
LENGALDILELAVGWMNAELSQSNELKFECLRVLGSLDEVIGVARMHDCRGSHGSRQSSWRWYKLALVASVALRSSTPLIVIRAAEKTPRKRSAKEGTEKALLGANPFRHEIRMRDIAQTRQALGNARARHSVEADCGKSRSDALNGKHQPCAPKARACPFNGR